MLIGKKTDNQIQLNAFAKSSFIFVISFQPNSINSINKMINIQKALSNVLQSSQSYGQEYVTLMESVGRFLAEDIHTDRDAL